MQWIRCFLLVLVVLRLLTGAAWAMPSPAIVTSAPMTEAMSCHEIESESESDMALDADVSSALCHVCCMGVLHTLMVLHIPTALPRHAPPVHHAQDVARWQHTPDLRPPI